MAHLFSTAGRHKQSKLSSSWNPRFWSAYHDENFQTITGKLLDWMESLCAMNPKAFGALYGLTPMNEPAHMRGLYDPDAANAESTYDLGGSKACGSSVSAAAVLDTLAISIIEFRKQPKLIQANKNLVMNVIETSFSETFGGKVDKAIFGASQNGTEAQYVTIGNAMRMSYSFAVKGTRMTLNLSMYIYMCIYTHIHTHTYIYIYTDADRSTNCAPTAADRVNKSWSHSCRQSYQLGSHSCRQC